jgi:2-iminobutanoate/2-iminopropanoate deaminase
MRVAIPTLAAATILLLSSACADRTTDAASAERASSSSGVEVFHQDDERGYSLASRYGDLVWTAGHLPADPGLGDDIQEQTDEVMKALSDTLEEAGAGFDTVVMTNVYLDDFDDWEGFNQTYKRYFKGHLPPRVTVQVGDLAQGKIEISMVAHVRD